MVLCAVQCKENAAHRDARLDGPLLAFWFWRCRPRTVDVVRWYRAAWNLLRFLFCYRANIYGSKGRRTYTFFCTRYDHAGHLWIRHVDRFLAGGKDFWSL